MTKHCHVNMYNLEMLSPTEGSQLVQWKLKFTLNVIVSAFHIVLCLLNLPHIFLETGDYTVVEKVN